MKKHFTSTFFILGFILASYLVWFAFEMSPGGNFSKNDSIKNAPLDQMINESDLDSIVNQYAIELKKMDIESLKKISTHDGLSSLLDWSDSLKNTDFIISITDNLFQRNIFDKVDNDSYIVLSLGEADEIVGATGGYLFLKKINNRFLINQYRGGK